MSKKSNFIKFMDELITEKVDIKSIDQEYQKDAIEYFNMLKSSDLEDSKPKFTENGKKILQWMQENKDTFNNMFKAKDVGEGIQATSKTASGALRKLVTDGYVEKIGSDPVVYSLTSSGIEATFEEE